MTGSEAAQRMQSETTSHEMARKLLVHSTLDHIFSAQYDVSRLPQLISQVGMQYIGCEFVSMWRYEPSEHLLYNLVARSNLNAGGDGERRPPPQFDLPAGSRRLPIERGPGKGIMMHLAADVLDGKRLEDMPGDEFIVNDRDADIRAAQNAIYDDASVIRSCMYAPLVYNGFKGMIVALNHERDDFTMEDWEILKILASKAAIVVDNIEQRNAAEQTSRLALLGRALDLVRHELKSPLTAIYGAAAVIQRTIAKLHLPEAEREMLQDMAHMISSEVDRNVRLLQDIQNYCKPRLEIPLSRGSVNAFLRDHVEQIAAAAGELKPQIELRLDDSLPEVSLSGDHLLEVLRNFVRNSAESGSKTVEMVTHRGSGDRVVIDVCDHGGGLEDAALRSLFRPYESRKSREGGSGLGLFISRRIIEEGHGGRLSAHNIYEGDARVGLCVRIDLPA